MTVGLAIIPESITKWKSNPWASSGMLSMVHTDLGVLNALGR